MGLAFRLKIGPLKISAPGSQDDILASFAVMPLRPDPEHGEPRSCWPDRSASCHRLLA